MTKLNRAKVIIGTAPVLLFSLTKAERSALLFRFGLDRNTFVNVDEGLVNKAIDKLQSASRFLNVDFRKRVPLNNLKNVVCPDCGEVQWSIADRNYVELYKTCWSCDRKRWSAHELSTTEFEKRELKAVEWNGNDNKL